MKSFLSKQIIVRFLDGKLTPEEESGLLNRKSVVARMKQQWDSQSGDISMFDQESVLQKVNSRIIVRLRRRAILAVASIAAGILLVMGIGLYLLRSDSTPNYVEVKMLSYETMDKERKQVTLPDSTKVWLNAGSRIEYPEVFDAAARQVKLCGEAYFDVTRRAKQPFYVLTEKIQIQVLGTRFTVSDYQNGKSAETVLISGKVNVSVLSDSNHRMYELLPNEQFLFDEQQHATIIQAVDASQMAEWINGRLIFDNAELGVIIGKLERWYGKKIDCSWELSASNRLSFTIRNESLTQVIELMQSIASISFQPTEDGYQVVAAPVKNNMNQKQNMPMRSQK